MQNDASLLLYLGIMLFGVLIAAVSQIMLKKAAMQVYPRWIDQYLNVRVIVAYGIFVLSTVCSVVAYQRVPLSMTPVWNASGQLFVTLFAYLLLGERPSRRKLLGLGIVVLGIVIFSL